MSSEAAVQDLALDEATRYAVAALFTLASYCTSMEGGFHLNGVGAADGVWGVPFDVITDSYSGKGATSTGWGWPIVGPSGVLGTVYAALGLRPTSAVCLLSLGDGLHPLATASQKDTLRELVTAFALHIDSAIEFAMSEVPRSALSLVTLAGAAADATGGDALDAVERTPSEADENGPKAPGSNAQASTTLDSRSGSAAGEPGDAGDGKVAREGSTGSLGDLDAANADAREEEALREALAKLEADPDAAGRIGLPLKGQCDGAVLTEGAVLPEPYITPAATFVHRAAAASVQAVHAVVLACAVPVAVDACSDQDRKHARGTDETRMVYSAHARVACKRVAQWLRVPCATMDALETFVLSDDDSGLRSVASDADLRKYHSKRKQWLKVGAAAAAGGVLTAVTAGLAAPAIVAGIGTMIGLAGSAGAAASVTAAAGSAASIGIVTGGSGAAGAAFYSSKMARRAADISEFGFVRLAEWEGFKARCSEAEASTAGAEAMSSDAAGTEEPADGAHDSSKRGGGSRHSLRSAVSEDAPGHSGNCAGSSGTQRKWYQRQRWSQRSSASVEGTTRQTGCMFPQDPVDSPMMVPRVSPGSGGVVIAATGWLASRDDFVAPFRHIGRRHGEVLCICWESKELFAINRAFVRMLAWSAGQQAVQLALYATVSSLAAATMWPVAVLNAAQFIDSAWDVACARAASGGKLLAHMLINGLHSGRPVTLVGTSIGARLIFHCCLELYKHGAVGLVENVVLLGAPLTTDKKRFQMARCMVAGRFVNVYSVTDWLLALCCRAKLGQDAFRRPAGNSAVCCPGIEDVNLSSMIHKHSDWCRMFNDIARIINLA